MKFYGLDYYFRRKKKMVILNSKVNQILPELMERNLKLMDRLQNKLKVSSFFNSIEQRNKKYLQDFIFSSDKRTKDLKTGVQMNKAIEQSSKNMSILCNNMNDDILIRNMNQLIKEKKLICQNTEEETHSKIEELLNNLKNAIKNPKTLKQEVESKIEKSYSAKDINDVKEYIGDKIKVEENKTNAKITSYLKKLNYIFKNCDCYSTSNDLEKNMENEEFKKTYLRRKKAINKLSDNFYLKKNIRLINYKKPKPFQLQDKEGANLNRIKNCLYPSLLDKLIIEKNEKDNLNKSDSSLQTQTILSNDSESARQNEENKNSSLSHINSRINPNNNFEVNIKEDELNTIKAHGKDTLEILNSLATHGKFLSERFDQKLKRVNSLIDLNLPHPKNYENLLNYSKINAKENLNKKYISFYPHSIKLRKHLKSRNDGNRTLPHLNINMKHKLTSIKEEIENKKFEKNMFDSIFSSYLGFNTTKNDKKRIVKLNKDIRRRKIIHHKASMDNIKQKKSESVFITLKKMYDEGNIRKIRKIRSCDIKKKE